MKNYLVGLFAILLGIGFSAFTPKKEKRSSGNPYFWYHVAGTQTVGTTLNPSGAVDKDDAMNDLTECDDQASPICLFGSTNANLPNNTSIGSNPPADQRIREKP